MENNQKLLQCFYCGNSTLMNLVGEHKYNWDEGEGYYGYFKYQMYSCPNCGKVTFFEQYWDCTQYTRDNDTFTEDQILYPINSFRGDYLPSKVKTAYESALKNRYIDSAVCLMALRRTLEMICKEKGAEGRDLWQKIEDLSRKGILPAELKHASTITKTYGNMGAHDSDIQIRPSELEHIIDFVKSIIDYLYILPYKLSIIQEQLENRRTKDHSA